MAMVLVVDNDPDFVKATTKVLERGGHQVASAANGSKALKAMREAPPETSISPWMSGSPSRWIPGRCCRG